MGEKIFVKPVGRIRQPERRMRPMPEAGAFVDSNDPYYARLLTTEDVVLADAPAAQSEPVAPADEPASEETDEGETE